MTPCVDVVLPVRDAQDTLPAAIESIVNQTLGAFRLFLVNDGSTDGSAECARACARKDSRVVILNTGGAGLVHALNQGIDAGDAPYIARMDADDTMHAERLERQVRHLDAHPHNGLVACGVAPEGLDRGFRHYVEWSNGLCTPDDVAVSRFIESPVVHPTVCFRRAVYVAHGGYRDGDFPEDYELWLRWMDQGVSFSKLPECLHCWTDHPRRLTRTDRRYRVEAFFAVKARYLSNWLRAHNPHHPRVWIWGAGAETRRRIRGLCEHGIQIEGFIDIDPRKIGTVTKDGSVYGPDRLPGPAHSFVLSAVGTRGAREKIAHDLEQRGYINGATYLAIA